MMGQNQSDPLKKGVQRRVLWGAVFLMATSAIGPAFLTQTTEFTSQFLASFAFAILASIIIDIGAQLNIWRVLVVSGKRGQDVANMVFPGLGYLVAALIVLGGIAFNIGNVAGAGLGINVLFGISPEAGAVITGVIAIIIFTVKSAEKVLDILIPILGIVMITMVGYVMITTNPPVGEAVVRSVFPEDYAALVLPVVTLVGGTVGGYITFAGAHRMIDHGIRGRDALPLVTRAANFGILTTGVMRVLLFLAVLGVVSAGYTLDEGNPAASVFQIALGNVGYKIFGVVLWSAAISSVIGSAYTSVSFIRSFHPQLEKYYKWLIIGFIAFSTIVFAIVGEPVTLLIVAGALNGLILPLTLGSVLLASRKKSIVGDYRHPDWMLIFGIVAVVVTLVAGFLSLQGIADLWQ
ncbi:Mn2+ and Fe2+ transporters of the NRAMP family [Marinococcus luteus]|uniref:Mn2+ and Fe2+ transporters of the NRAMP family n=1 Tax=Marinococcus luteus TaxID=1122204 RepID=A0A1H2TGJ4_9BACI|nr:Mn2+ and Fe2+ transporters of the NRAMP family [Marinococcus luteus]